MEIYGTINETGNGEWDPPIYPGKCLIENIYDIKCLD